MGERSPSPYLAGHVDKFFDEVLAPMMQTTRGCPYTCTFCWEGGDYFKKTKRFSNERIKAELHYIADRVKNIPDFQIVDANFGMFKDDLETAKEIMVVKRGHPYSWPKSIISATAKNHKERTIELVEILGDIMPPKASIQSTDDTVLGNIRRKNVSISAMVEMAKASAKEGGQSESEIILCLEGDTKKAHFQSVFDMLDAGMTYIRMYQFIMLPGTQSNSTEARTKFQVDTRFRVMPRCFGFYSLYDQSFPVAEIDEFVIANSTMSYTDYQDCRELHLTVEIFNNDSIFLDLIQLLNLYNIPRSEFIRAVHKKVKKKDSVISELYSSYCKEEMRNLSDTMGDLETFTHQSNNLQQYLDGYYGTNELLKYRYLATFENIEALHELAYGVSITLLKKRDQYSTELGHFLKELHKFSLMRKMDTLATEQTTRAVFHYDFPKLMGNSFTLNPFKVSRPDGVEIEFFHSSAQRDLISGYINQHGTSMISLGKILVRANLGRMYRSARIS
jgi:hypothetical protein